MGRGGVGDDSGGAARHQNIVWGEPPVLVRDVLAPRDVGPRGIHVVAADPAPERAQKLADVGSDLARAHHEEPLSLVPAEQDPGGLHRAPHHPVRRGPVGVDRAVQRGQHVGAQLVQVPHVVKVGVHVATGVHRPLQGVESLRDVLHELLLADGRDVRQGLGVGHELGTPEPGVVDGMLERHASAELRALRHGVLLRVVGPKSEPAIPGPLRGHRGVHPDVQRLEESLLVLDRDL
mmetsp:Transcript_6404/g.19332  ORF Transcript_6404/g.19332 Transcript_6404/m.19332 type:complete len:235 (-) Transcript_6404:456-1160(-)